MIAELLILAAKLAAVLAVMLAVYGVGHRRGFRAALDTTQAEVTRRLAARK